MLLLDNQALELPATAGPDDGLWVAADALAAPTGWQLKPEGLCRDDTCVPVPPGQQARFVRDGQVNLAAFWRHLGHPVLHDAAGTVWALGEGAAQRRAQLASLEAPDFALPNLDGHTHRLSDHRGRKVLLATWASW